MSFAPRYIQFVALLFVAGFFNFASAQNTVPATQGAWKCGNTNFGYTFTEDAQTCFNNMMSSSYASARSSYGSYWGENKYNSSDPYTLSGTATQYVKHYYQRCYYEGRATSSYYCPNFSPETNIQAYFVWDGSASSCPSSHPVDNGDGTCSTDTAHEEFCQGLATEGVSFWDTQNAQSCTVVQDGNPQNYACAFERDDIGVGFGGEEPQFEYTATGGTCSGEIGGGGTGGSDPLAPSAPITGDNLGGGSAPGTDPSAPANDESSSYLGDKLAFETRTQTGELLDGMAEAVNQRNLNHDKNSQFIVEGLSDLAKVNKQIGSDIERAVRSSGGSGDGDPAGWGVDEDVSIDSLDCIPDPITGRCTNWSPLTEQKLPEQVINLDQEIAQFDQMAVVGECPTSLPLDLSFGSFEYNSGPVCETLSGIRYLLLALAYFIVARVIVRSVGV